LHRVS